MAKENSLLTPRQREILQRMVDHGETYRELGRFFGISHRVVKNHLGDRLDDGSGRSGLYERLGVQDKTGAVIRGLQEREVFLRARDEGGRQTIYGRAAEFDYKIMARVEKLKEEQRERERRKKERRRKR